ncbi:MBOAT, membrane-bound O-acyltransferase family-domain-containing protein [Syncephalis fuscata]|nr:MBOAT, membrane-bound O-acyltransferase family-domain-containing protein [Syncephalis fuscata]
MRERSPTTRVELATFSTTQPDASTNEVTKEERRSTNSVSPSRWNTKEFYVYYATFITVVPYMIWSTYHLSSESMPNYKVYEHTLSDGWIFGRKIDNTDAQYREFRRHIPLLAMGAAIYVIISNLLDKFTSTVKDGQVVRNIAARRIFYLVSSALFMVAISGANIIKIILIVSINYAVAKIGQGSRWNPLITWIFNLAVLLFNDQFEGYRYSEINSALAFFDNHRGLMPRWEIHFKFAMLRMVSFNMDYYWCCQGAYQELDTNDKGHVDNERSRIQSPRKPHEYNYANYLTYLFYIPLFLAGPIITFNNFIAQMHHKPSSITVKSTILYGLRVLGAILTMELMMHYLYVLLIIWRFFRLWAMADNVEVIENMNRCMSNNYSAQGFWRSWHRSYNRWLIRYVYIPMGGSQYATYNMWPVFTFVAVWHDVSFKLLAWAWLICLFLLPEIVLTRVFRPYRKWKYYRHVAAIGGVGNMIMMAVANLVGFAVGVDGMKEMGRLILTPNGIGFLILGPMCIFVAVQLMFEIRESEKRRGVTGNNF